MGKLKKFIIACAVIIFALPLIGCNGRKEEPEPPNLIRILVTESHREKSEDWTFNQHLEFAKLNGNVEYMESFRLHSSNEYRHSFRIYVKTLNLDSENAYYRVITRNYVVRIIGDGGVGLSRDWDQTRMTIIPTVLFNPVIDEIFELYTSHWCDFLQRSELPNIRLRVWRDCRPESEGCCQ